MDKQTVHCVEKLLNSLNIGKLQVITVKQVEGPQGRSGSLVEYFQAETSNNNISIVRKTVSELERNVVALLGTQHSAIPPTYIDMSRSQIYQLFVDEVGFVSDTKAPLFVSTASSLAKIHAQNLNKRPSWLQRANKNPLQSIGLGNWRREWELNQNLPGFIDEFRSLLTPLEDAEQQLFNFMDSGSYQESSTLIMADVLPDHVRIYDGEVCYIDWGQARFGSLYLDLANIYDTEAALVYRDCLEAMGVSIEKTEFINSYKVALKYAGLRYLATGLRNWRDKRADWPAQKGFMSRCINLAINEI